MREFLMLAHTYAKQDVRGWYWSEKLDGMRVFWDGGITRGVPTLNVPWANLDKNVMALATGLWSRYGNVIVAPDWWLDRLPVRVPLDGEGSAGRGRFQYTMSVMRKHTPVDHEWRDIEFCVFDCPPYYAVFSDGRINNPNFKKEIKWAECKTFLDKHKASDFRGKTMQDTMSFLRAGFPEFYHPQYPLPKVKGRVETALLDAMLKVEGEGGEGIIVRNPISFWSPHRSHWMLKLKSVHDDEAIIAGYVWGQGKLEGLMGAAIVDWKGQTFELSGFTDQERAMVGSEPRTPGARVKDAINPYFPIGSMITFKYRELSDAGIPKEARYYRTAHPA